MPTPKPVVLCILDGWGLRDDRTANAPKLANTPHFDRVMQGPHAKLLTHGKDAGLPKGKWATLRLGIQISEQVGLLRWIWDRSNWRLKTDHSAAPMPFRIL